MDTNDEETTLEKLSDEKMAEYDSSQDADYVPESSQESQDIDYNSQASEVVTEESTQEESQETEP